MTLTSGKGPLSGRPAGRFSAPIPEGVSYVEPHRRRVRAMTSAGETVIDTDLVLLIHRPGQPPTYGFPVDEVPAGLGTPVPEADGFVEVAWGTVDSWFEEGLEVIGHARNPYHRIDCLPTERHLRVEVAGVVLVDSPATIALYETALEPRLYVARDLVRRDLLVPSDTTTWCNYKGRTKYFSAAIGHRIVADVAWTYETPFPESTAITGLLAFEPTVAEVTADFPPPAI